MIIPSSGVDKALGVHLQKIYKTNATGAVEQAGRRDVVSISSFSALVEKGRNAAMGLPDVRADRVSQARLSLEMGDIPDTRDIASSLINRAVEGQV